MRSLALGAAALVLSATAGLAEFRIAFEWGDIPLCTTGRPNVVPSPAFSITDLPAGTTSVQFKLKDLDAPRYNHGGKTLGISQSGVLPVGVFTYKSPCPPSGVHTYEWTATAKKGSQVLGVAKARRTYPE
jgi:hypothetical protein